MQHRPVGNARMTVNQLQTTGHTREVGAFPVVHFDSEDNGLADRSCSAFKASVHATSSHLKNAKSVHSDLIKLYFNKSIRA